MRTKLTMAAVAMAIVLVAICVSAESDAAPNPGTDFETSPSEETIILYPGYSLVTGTEFIPGDDNFLGVGRSTIPVAQNSANVRIYGNDGNARATVATNGDNYPQYDNMVCGHYIYDSQQLEIYEGYFAAVNSEGRAVDIKVLAYNSSGSGQVVEYDASNDRGPIYVVENANPDNCFLVKEAPPADNTTFSATGDTITVKGDARYEYRIGYTVDGTTYYSAWAPSDSSGNATFSFLGYGVNVTYATEYQVQWRYAATYSGSLPQTIPSNAYTGYVCTPPEKATDGYVIDYYSERISPNLGYRLDFSNGTSTFRNTMNTTGTPYLSISGEDLFGLSFTVRYIGSDRYSAIEPERGWSDKVDGGFMPVRPDNVTAPGLSVTSGSVTFTLDASTEYRVLISNEQTNREWTGSTGEPMTITTLSKFGGNVPDLKPSTSYRLEYRVAATDSTFRSGIATVTFCTAPDVSDSNVISFNYTAETLNLGSGYEAATDEGFNSTLANGDSIKTLLESGATIYVRVANATEDQVGVSKVELPARPSIDNIKVNYEADTVTFTVSPSAVADPVVSWSSSREWANMPATRTLSGTSNAYTLSLSDINWDGAAATLTFWIVPGDSNFGSYAPGDTTNGRWSCELPARPSSTVTITGVSLTADSAAVTFDGDGEFRLVDTDGKATAWADSTVSGLAVDTSYTLEYRAKGTESTLPGPSATVSVRTGPNVSNASVITFDYTNETLSLGSGYEAGTDAGLTTRIADGDSVTGLIDNGASIYVRSADAAEVYVGVSELKVPARPSIVEDSITIDYDSNSVNFTVESPVNNPTVSWSSSNEWTDIPSNKTLRGSGNAYTLSLEDINWDGKAVTLTFWIAPSGSYFGSYAVNDDTNGRWSIPLPAASGIVSIEDVDLKTDSVSVTFDGDGEYRVLNGNTLISGWTDEPVTGLSFSTVYTLEYRTKGTETTLPSPRATTTVCTAPDVYNSSIIRIFYSMEQIYVGYSTSNDRYHNHEASVDPTFTDSTVWNCKETGINAVSVTDIIPAAGEDPRIIYVRSTLEAAYKGVSEVVLQPRPAVNQGGIYVDYLTDSIRFTVTSAVDSPVVSWSISSNSKTGTVEGSGNSYSLPVTDLDWDGSDPNLRAPNLNFWIEAEGDSQGRYSPDYHFSNDKSGVNEGQVTFILPGFRPSNDVNVVSVDPAVDSVTVVFDKDCEFRAIGSSGSTHLFTTEWMDATGDEPATLTGLWVDTFCTLEYRQKATETNYAGVSKTYLFRTAPDVTDPSVIDFDYDNETLILPSTIQASLYADFRTMLTNGDSVTDMISSEATIYVRHLDWYPDVLGYSELKVPARPSIEDIKVDYGADSVTFTVTPSSVADPVVSWSSSTDWANIPDIKTVTGTSNAYVLSLNDINWDGAAVTLTLWIAPGDSNFGSYVPGDTTNGRWTCELPARPHSSVTVDAISMTANSATVTFSGDGGEFRLIDADGVATPWSTTTISGLTADTAYSLEYRQKATDTSLASATTATPVRTAPELEQGETTITMDKDGNTITKIDYTDRSSTTTTERVDGSTTTEEVRSDGSSTRTDVTTTDEGKQTVVTEKDASGTITSNTTSIEKNDGTSTTITNRNDGTSTSTTVENITDGTKTVVTEKDASGNTTETTTITKTETTDATSGDKVNKTVTETVYADGRNTSKTEVTYTSQDGRVVTDVTSSTDSSGSTTTETTVTVETDNGTIDSGTVNTALRQIDEAEKDVGTSDASRVMKVEPKNATSDSVGISIASDDIRRIADKGVVLEIVGQVGSMMVSPEVSETLASGSGNVLMSLSVADSSEMSDAVLDVVGNRPAYQLRAENGATVHELGGNVTVTTPYTLSDREIASTVEVIYVDNNGNTTAMQTTYENGTVAFVTDHFSYYFINSEFEPEADPSGTDEPGGGGSNALLFVGIGVALIAIIGAVVLYMRRM